MRAVISSFILLLTLSFASCANNSAGDEVRREAQTVYSWAETVKMVCDDLESGAVPKHYAERTLEKARSSMQDEIESFTQSNAPSNGRAQLLAEMQSLENIFGQIQSAIQQGDSNSLASSVEQLKVVQEQVNLLKNSGGS